MLVFLATAAVTPSLSPDLATDLACPDYPQTLPPLRLNPRICVCVVHYPASCSNRIYYANKVHHTLFSDRADERNLWRLVIATGEVDKIRTSYLQYKYELVAVCKTQVNAVAYLKFSNMLPRILLLVASGSASVIDASCRGNDPVVDLGYAKYEGTALASGINQFLGIRYAAPPTGHMRWRAPGDPYEDKTLRPAKEVRSSPHNRRNNMSNN